MSKKRTNGRGNGRVQSGRRRAPRRDRMMARVIAASTVLAIIVTTGLALSRGGSGPVPSTFASGTPSDRLLGLQTGPAPWAPEYSGLQARLAADGLPPAEASEHLVLHAHQHVDLYIQGRRVPVPKLIGIVSSGAQLFAPVHTHDADGVVHIESPVVRTFTLGDFFDVWGVRLTPACLGGYCASGTESLRIFSNGSPVPGDPRQLALVDHQEVVVAFGTTSQLPLPIPASYSFQE